MTVEIICDNEECDEQITNREGCFQVIEGKAVVDLDSSVIEQENYPGMFCSKKCLIEELSCSCETFDDGCSECISGLRVKTSG